ncbi:hypothetical protein FB561_5268 [Kribbella amoyensis]|uniref:Uncharacterized protein n=1 Tax=Kribbella amoyensis TaxID=996641 RepID=A0A561BYY8_9ACTN|nr:DUF6412 domain-containing protein [Kribbella amoyensis]TWD84094.1 hypothetical protein FB561_5268 [Kribbella amoyensis]
MGQLIAAALSSAIAALDSPFLAAAVLTAAAVLLSALLVSRRSAPVLVPVRAVAARERSEQVAFLRLRDPGAPGRPRPRAPGQ